MHREGFFKITKYGMLVVVPLWYLAMQRRLPLMAPTPRRRWTVGLIVASLVVTVGYTAADWSGWGQPHGWRVPARADTLVWQEAPQVAAALCGWRGRAGDAAILVLGLDERRPIGVGITWLGVEAAQWESDLGALPHVLRQAGCRTVTRYPNPTLPLARVLRGGDGEPDLLCAPVRADASGGPVVPPEDGSATMGRGRGARPAVLPSHILVTYLAASHRPELTRLLAAAPECPWRVERELTNAVLLGRAGRPSPAAAAAGAGSQPASQPGHGVRQRGQ
jgi:hypothetical protein